MKLYTEEQIIKAFKAGMSACMKHQDWALVINYPNKIELTEYIESITPIELPSDEEIIKEASYNHYGTNFKKVFKNGAKWVIDNIKKQ